MGAGAAVAPPAGWWRKAVGQGMGGGVTVRAPRSQVSVAAVGGGEPPEMEDGGWGHGQKKSSVLHSVVG